MAIETTKGFDPLKGLAVIAYFWEIEGGEGYLSLRVLFDEAFGETPRELDWSSLAATLAFIYYS